MGLGLSCLPGLVRVPRADDDYDDYDDDDDNDNDNDARAPFSLKLCA
jgi:hypothetical protein